MTRFSVFGLLIGLAGCGSTIGAFDGLPEGADVKNAPWPRLVDTPEPPEGRLTAGNGVRAFESLTSQRGQSEARLARADTVPPVSDSLLTRGGNIQSRTENTAPPINEADLLTRAERLQARSELGASAVDEEDLLARAARLQARSGVAESTVIDTDLQARAELQQRRTLQQLPVDEAGLLARTDHTRRNAGPAPLTNVQAAPAVPRPPVPLRPLDTPVVSSSFEERARLARERAAGL